MALFSSQIRTRDLVPMCRQLATSYEAGIPILRSIALVRDNMRDQRSRQVLGDMEHAIRNGATLGDAARAQSKYLPSFLTELLGAGEHGGRLDIMLKDLADYYEDQQRMHREVRGMMAYPVFVMLFAWFLGSFSLGLIRSIDFVSGKPFNFNEFFQWYARFQGAATLVMLGVFAGAVVLSRLGLLNWATGWVAYFVWPFRMFTRKFALARFFRSMALLVQSGVNIKHCISGAAATTANPYIQRDLMQAIPWVAQGATLTQAFSGVRALTPTSREMLHVGETSGRLEQQLHKVSEYHHAEASAALKAMLRIFYLGVYLAAAATVGYIVISFYARYLGAIDSLLDV